MVITANLHKAVLKFDGIEMPTPKFNGFKISKNKIWSKNTGRNGNGDMVGTIIAVKRKVEITWPILEAGQISLIDNIVSNPNTPYHQVQYTDESGNVTEITAYFNDASYPILSVNLNGKQLLEGVGINGIEK